MKKFGSLCAAVVMGLTLAGVAHAAPTPDADTTPSRDRTVTPDERRSPDAQSDESRVVTGRVLRVNADEGTIVIQTPMGVLALRGPSEDLREVSVGDIVQVEMVTGDGDNFPSASPPMNDQDEDSDSSTK
jgi:hypothetical protein